jgi:hypothetical protein
MTTRTRSRQHNKSDNVPPLSEKADGYWWIYFSGRWSIAMVRFLPRLSWHRGGLHVVIMDRCGSFVTFNLGKRDIPKRFWGGRVGEPAMIHEGR